MSGLHTSVHGPGGWNLLGRLSEGPAEHVDLSVPDFGWLTDRLTSSVEWLSFWLAVALPVAYVPLLASGFTTPLEGGVFAALLALHAVSLLVGNDHDPA